MKPFDLILWFQFLILVDLCFHERIGFDLVIDDQINLVFDLIYFWWFFRKEWHLILAALLVGWPIGSKKGNSLLMELNILLQLTIPLTVYMVVVLCYLNSQELPLNVSPMTHEYDILLFAYCLGEAGGWGSLYISVVYKGKVKCLTSYPALIFAFHT